MEQPTVVRHVSDVTVDFQATLKDVLVCDIVLMALTFTGLPSTEHVAVFFFLFVTCPRSFWTICHVNLFFNNNNNNNNNHHHHHHHNNKVAAAINKF